MPVEKIEVEIARELCQFNSIEIYPVEWGWHTYIAVSIAGKEKRGKRCYIEPLLTDTIAEMWLHYASKIRKAISTPKLEMNMSQSAAAVGLYFLLPLSSFTLQTLFL